MKFSKLKEIIKEELKYQDVFKKALKKYNISSPDELDDKKKKEFYDFLDTNWDAGKNETDLDEYGVKGMEWGDKLKFPDDEKMKKRLAQFKNRSYRKWARESGLEPDHLDNLNRWKEMNNIEEKAVSKNQQQFMGMVHAVQKGKLDPSKVSQKVKDTAENMKNKDVKDFASTKHKRLPTKITEKLKDDIKKYDIKNGIWKKENNIRNIKEEISAISVNNKYRYSLDGGDLIVKVTALTNDSVDVVVEKPGDSGKKVGQKLSFPKKSFKFGFVKEGVKMKSEQKLREYIKREIKNILKEAKFIDSKNLKTGSEKIKLSLDLDVKFAINEDSYNDGDSTIEINLNYNNKDEIEKKIRDVIGDFFEKKYSKELKGKKLKERDGSSALLPFPNTMRDKYK